MPRVNVLRDHHHSGARLLKASQSTRPLIAAVLAATMSMLPVHLLGASSVLLREDLHFDQAHLGMAVAAFFGLANSKN